MKLEGIVLRFVAEAAGDGVPHHLDDGLFVLRGGEELPVGLQGQKAQLAPGVLAELHQAQGVPSLFALEEGEPGVLRAALRAVREFAPVRHDPEEGEVRLGLRHAGEGGALVPQGSEAGLQHAALKDGGEAAAGPVAEKGLLFLVEEGPAVELQLVQDLLCRHDCVINFCDHRTSSFAVFFFRFFIISYPGAVLNETAPGASLRSGVIPQAASRSGFST